jgi:DnaJ-class molecular chaperone
VDAVSAAKKPTTRRRTAKPEPVKCPTCKGTGEVSRTVRVGRRQRPVGQQTGLCLACLGSGQAPNSAV